jgi:alpha-tubulin suppressor-like RCC1 family protein
VATSGFHTAAIKTDGTLWSWGCNNCGQLGSNIVTARCSPVAEITGLAVWTCVATGEKSCSTAAIKIDGSLWTWGRNNSGDLGDGTTTNRSSPVREILSASNWCSVSGAYGGGSALKTDGSLWSWGCNAYGQIGDNTAVGKCSPTREFCSFTDWCAVSALRFGRTAIRTKS